MSHSRAFDRREIEPAQSIRVREDVHLGDSFVGDRKADHGEGSTVGTSLEQANITIHQDDLIGPTQPRERRSPTSVRPNRIQEPMRIELTTVHVDDQEKALRSNTDVLGAADRLTRASQVLY